MERREYREEGQRARIKYRLAEMRQAMGLPFVGMTQWGDRWLADGRPPLTLRSKATGQKIAVALVDERERIAR